MSMSFTDEQKREIKELVHEAINEWIKSYGLLGKNLILGLAAVFIALAVIGKGFAWLLGVIGFSYIK